MKIFRSLIDHEFLTTNVTITADLCCQQLNQLGATVEEKTLLKQNVRLPSANITKQLFWSLARSWFRIPHILAIQCSQAFPSFPLSVKQILRESLSQAICIINLMTYFPNQPTSSGVELGSCSVRRVIVDRGGQHIAD